MNAIQHNAAVQRDTDADRIFFGGDIVTVDAGMSTAEAVAVRGDRIVAVGAREEVMRLRGPATAMVDLEGRALLPGFVEPHSHPLLTGLSRGDPTVDIRSVTVPTYEAVLGLVRRRLAKAAPGEFLMFHGLDPLTHRGMREPTLAELDALAPSNPIAIQTNSSHAMYLNSLALVHFGIDANTPNPGSGEVVKDASGKPTGKLMSAATHLVKAPFWKALGDERGMRVFGEWAWKHARAGYTTTSELSVRPLFMPLLERVRGDAAFPIRIFGYAMSNAEGTTPTELNWGDDRLRMIGAKFLADGSPFVGNVWLSRPYLVNEVTVGAMKLPPGHTGHMHIGAEELARQVDLYAASGWQLATHTQGDRSFGVVLDAYQAAIRKHGLTDHRFRIEHCALPQPDQIARAVQLGVTFSFFIPHLHYWGDVIRDQLFGPERAAHYMPVGSAMRAGMRGVSLHCDAPSVDPDALLCLDLAVNRRSKSGAVIGETECIPVDDALRALTINGAWQLKMEDRVGSIEPGKYADFVVLNRNPRTTPAASLRALKVLGTWLGGREIWHA